MRQPQRTLPTAHHHVNRGKPATLELLTRGFGVRAFAGISHPFGSPDLSTQLYGVLCAYDEGRTGARPTSIDQAAYARQTCHCGNSAAYGHQSGTWSGVVPGA